jgi:flagellar motility protein MotE (MotC chaperone)
MNVVVDLSVLGACCTIVGLAFIARGFPWEKLRRPDVERIDADVKIAKSAVTALQDANVDQRFKLDQRSLELDEKLTALTRRHDDRLHELEQQMHKLTRDMTTRGEQFTAMLDEAKAERTKVIATLNERRPGMRFG